MKQVTVIVTDETAEQLYRLIDKGKAKGRAKGAVQAFDLAHHSRPIRGERWIRVSDLGDNDNGHWARLLKPLTLEG